MKIGMIGLGTVGTGVAEWLIKKAHPSLCLKRIADIDIERERQFMPEKSLLTTDAHKVLDDLEIDTVVELIGGIEPAKSYIMKAFEQKKDVVTANKALLSSHWVELMESAKRHNRKIRFEAAVCGGIPLLASITSGLIANRISALYGIINGTTNYILTKMEEGIEFSDALSDAQKRGYAEADPTLDIEGVDTAHKLSILSALCFGRWCKPDSIYIEGISQITAADIQYAKELGYSIKLLGIAKGNVLKVHPTLLPKTHPLSSVSGVYNGVYIEGDLTGPILFTGKGAGMRPTASAVISDLLALARNEEFVLLKTEEAEPIPISETTSRYYVRFQAEDKPGVLAAISGILAEHKISIASCIQKERGDVVPIIMVTHDAKEADFVSALRKIEQSPKIKEALMIRMEE
jgi:homoserine dehydrogenase